MLTFLNPEFYQGETFHFKSFESYLPFIKKVTLLMFCFVDGYCNGLILDNFEFQLKDSPYMISNFLTWLECPCDFFHKLTEDENE